LGFLGTLHCSVFEDRLLQEHGGSILITAPTVPYRITYTDGKQVVIRNPSDFPDGDLATKKVSELAEPIVLATIIVPQDHLGSVIELCEVDISSFDTTQRRADFFSIGQPRNSS